MASPPNAAGASARRAGHGAGGRPRGCSPGAGRRPGRLLAASPPVEPPAQRHRAGMAPTRPAPGRQPGTHSRAQDGGHRGASPTVSRPPAPVLAPRGPQLEGCPATGAPCLFVARLTPPAPMAPPNAGGLLHLGPRRGGPVRAGPLQPLVAPQLPEGPVSQPAEAGVPARFEDWPPGAPPAATAAATGRAGQVPWGGGVRLGTRRRARREPAP